MSVVLNAETIRTLVSPTGEDPLVTALYIKQLHKTMVGLSRLRRKLMSEGKALVTSTGFSAAFESLSTFPYEAQKQVLTYPSAGFWLDVALSLVRRQAHLRFPELHMQMHLMDFQRFVLAAAVLGGVDRYEAEVWADTYGNIYLPGTGVYLIPQPPVAYQRLHVSLHFGGFSLTSANSRQCPIEYEVQKVPVGMHCFELNAIDPDLHLPGRTSFVYETIGPAEIVRWKTTLESAWDWITESAPCLAKEMTMGIRAIVPVVSDGPEIHASATFREAPGLMALSWTADTSVMAEAIVHEYHHQKLNTLLNLDQLITGPTGDAIYYSPWRKDPRPLVGILHGTYVFQAVLEFWHAVFSAGIPLLHTERIRQRVHLIRWQTQLGLETLMAHVQWTPLGYALFDAMKENFARHSNLAPIDKAIWNRIVQTQAQHRADWEARNGHLVSSETNELAVRATVLADEVGVVLRKLGVSTDFNPTSLNNRMYTRDEILDAVIGVYHEQGPASLEQITGMLPASGTSLHTDLLRAHIGYVVGRYDEAAEAYASCLTHQSGSAYFWQCFAFALRHLGRNEESDCILAQLGALTKGQLLTELPPAAANEWVNVWVQVAYQTLNSHMP